MAGGEDDAIEHSHGEIAIFGVAGTKPADEWHGYDVDYADGHHRAYRAAGVEFGSLVDILCHGSAESAIRQVDAGIAQYQDAVGHCHVDDLGGLAPFGVCPEGEYQHQCRDRGSEEQPWAESSPASMGLVGECADDWVVDSIPESGYKHQGGYSAHADSKHVCVEYHEEVAYKHPTEVAAHVAHAIGELADEGNFTLCIVFLRAVQL